jgi:hypothetical protein
MKFIKALYFISTIILSITIVGVSCLQYAVEDSAIQTPFEEPIDDDAKDFSDDYADDKENTSNTYLPSDRFSIVIHSVGYLISHANQVKEISTPPPKF